MAYENDFNPYSKYKNRKLPKQSRTIPVKGYAEAKGRFYRCWNCGFVCDIKRDDLGDSQSMDGVTYENYSVPSQGSQDSSSSLNSLAILDGGIEHFQVALKEQADGTAQPIYHRFVAVISHGCPFCGTLNWKGDYP